ncbi:peroxisome biogenesis factor 10 [Orussus abietinus]|uniref:peroxisome biogenesis factor 10 n=1 Tax=Orussus abietinus TaxID=222816 RepID=UPI00062519D2|nr:peroxisome biogenesis factor 10 [Orussus abietinus]
MSSVSKSDHKLSLASQAEILRARQRDDDFIEHLRERYNNLLHKVGGYRTALRFLRSDVPAKLVYFAATSGLGNQTLGEEYTGIVQANLNVRKVPSLTARITSVMLECFGEWILLDFLERLRKSIHHPQYKLTQKAKTFFDKLLSGLRLVVPTLIFTHRGLFYIFGRYYSLGKRLTSIDYVKVYGRHPADGIYWGLRLLGVVTLLRCILQLQQSQDTSHNEASENTLDVGRQTGDKCRLCLEADPTTATPCGHCFCWSCLTDWLRSEPRCPLCRERITPSRVVHLKNP